MAKYIAIDLGASNGRVIVGDIAGGFEVVNRFVTKNEHIGNEVYWDVLSIFSEIKKGLMEAFSRYPSQIVSIGIDTWGVDFGLLDEHGSLIAMPYHYRDARTDGMIDEVAHIIDNKTLFERTGIAFHSFNTLYQLYAMKKNRSQVFGCAKNYLSIPDLITYWLTGKKVNEISHASTTQLFNPHTKDWDWQTIETLGFPQEIFGQIVPSGTVVGPLSASLQNELGANSDVVVVAVGNHDTASAVAAVPSQHSDFLYISSGTWSLLGVETPKPIITEEALSSGFTNEMAVSGNIRFLKNIMGMWIQQECVRYWEQKGETIQWKELDEETIACESYEGYIDPDDLRFLKPNSHSSLMVDRVCDNCQELGYRKPESKGEYMVAIYRGLSHAYKKAIDHLQEITGTTYTSLHIIGGGSKNEILNQWTADSTKLPVQAGPVEATALGNMLVQQLATGSLSSLEAGRKSILQHQKITHYTPR